MRHTGKMVNCAGVPIFVSNDTIDGDGFYVSCDSHCSAYGTPTTALVVGQMEKFFILKGNHMSAYAERIPQGLEACMAYYRENKNLIHPYSDKE